MPFPALAFVDGPHQGWYKEENLLQKYTGFEISMLKPSEKIKLMEDDQNDVIYLVEKNGEQGLILRLVKSK